MTAANDDSFEIDARVQRLRGPLLNALEVSTRRSSRGVYRAGVGVSLAVAAALVLLAPGGSTAPALAVDRTSDWLQLTIADATASPDDLTKDLREAGVDGEVRVIPVPPDLVGKWATVLYHVEQPLQPGEAPKGRPDRVQFGQETIRIPIEEVRSARGDFVFFLGRAAAPGETYVYDGRAFPRGPFPNGT